LPIPLPDVCPFICIRRHGLALLQMSFFRALFQLAQVALLFTLLAGFADCCASVNDVLFEGNCYYLDGTGGACNFNNATLGSNAQLAAILAANASAWQGLNYRSTISDNCCVWVSVFPEEYGMDSNCNSNGPFAAGQPIYNGARCAGATLKQPKQLTLCVYPSVIVTNSTYCCFYGSNQCDTITLQFCSHVKCPALEGYTQCLSAKTSSCNKCWDLPNAPKDNEQTAAATHAVV